MSFFRSLKGGVNGYMQRKMKMLIEDDVTFKGGFEGFLDNCKARNLRPATINHYKEAYKSIVRFLMKTLWLKILRKKL